MAEEVFISLKNEGVEVWRPAKAKKIGDAIYEILPQDTHDEE